MERTISGMMGKGSVNHNTRAFSAKNVDKERSRDNVEFCHKDIKAVYHELFDEALERYNAKQKRSDRKIDNYYEKIRQGKQEKLFHEVIFQIGNKDDMNVRSEEGQLAKQILSDFMADFQSRNPNLHVFSAHLHMDEETPHIHIDFVPVITGSKRGLDTRVSLKGALAAQGFEGGTRGATEWNQWIESEKKELAAVMERYGVEWLQKGTHKKHLSVLDYEKQERAKEVAELDSQLAQSERALQTASKMVDNQFARVEELAEMGDKFQRRNEEIKADNAELEKTYVDTKQSYNNFQTEEPSVCDIDFDFFYCLAHTSDAVQILDEWNFNEHDRIHAGAAIVCTVFIDHKIIDKTPVDCLVNQAQQMILRNKVIHAEHLNLFSFLICILCHHRKHRLYFDTFIIPKK